MRSREEMIMLQSLPLEVKVEKTKQRIREWVEHYGESGCYISFSGGKDSTVLLDLVRNKCGYKNIPAVFVDTGLEYPEIREFVKTFDNVVWLKPKKNFKRVIEEYGYPFITKEVSENVYGARKYLTRIINELESDRQTDRQTDLSLLFREDNRNRNRIYSKNNSIPSEEELAKVLNERMKKRAGGSNQRLAIMLGWLTKSKENPIMANPPKTDRSNYAMPKYRFLLFSPYSISNKCCNVMKKAPAHSYYHRTNRVPMTGEQAQESNLRMQKWIQNGCNGFDLKIPKSTPMAFWTEQDILLYINQNKLPICSVYGDIIEDNSNTEEVIGQMTISDVKGFEDQQNFDAPPLPLKTTGCSRTGCMFCGYGCHLEKPGEGRFELMKKTYPRQYEWIMKPKEQGGLGYKEVIDWLNENGNLNIRY